MFDVGYSELLVVAIVALVVIGPKELPNVLRKLGRLTGKARAMSRHLRAGFDEMVRQAELEEMEKEWQAHNARIMTEYPDTGALPASTLHAADAGETNGDATPEASPKEATAGETTAGKTNAGETRQAAPQETSPAEARLPEANHPTGSAP